MKDLLKRLEDQAPELLKDNKGAVIGAVIGYLVTNSEKAKSTILGAVAGSLLGDKKDV